MALQVLETTFCSKFKSYRPDHLSNHLAGTRSVLRSVTVESSPGHAGTRGVHLFIKDCAVGDAYDTEDSLLSITDANNHTTQFAYNARGWVTQTTVPSTLQESYTYDAAGNLLSKTDRKNQTIQYVYDALYRLTSKTYPDSTRVEYAYDLAGKVQQVSDPAGTYSFAYDNMGRPIGTTTQYSYLPSINFQNAYTYDAASNRTSLTAPDGSITTYGYDTLNRLNGLANSWAGLFGFGYDALSRRTSLTRPNGVSTNYSTIPSRIC